MSRINPKLRKHLTDLNYLPDFLKDFHDQKDVFKALHTQFDINVEHHKMPNWVDAQIYSIDFFLYFMGSIGYKLQKDRTKNIEFTDLEEWIQAYKNERPSLSEILK